MTNADVFLYHVILEKNPSTHHSVWEMDIWESLMLLKENSARVANAGNLAVELFKCSQYEQIVLSTLTVL